MSTGRWVLAFDGGCQKCRETSRAISRSCDDKLEVLPLTHPDVQLWRNTALGDEAPWAPTLIAVDDTETRAWTGRSMGIPLARHLGARSTMRVLFALGRLHQRARGGAQRRRQPLTPLAVGSAIALGMLLKGAMPAFAETPGSRARAWVAANKSNLPKTYDDLIQHDIDHRRAIYQASPPEVRSRMWRDHLERQRNSELNEEQSSVIDRALALMGNTANLGNPDDPEIEQKFDSVGDAAVQAFGSQRAHELFAHLGPANDAPSVQDARKAECSCNRGDPYCGGGSCGKANCKTTSSGCGWGWERVCDGLCL